MPIQRRKFRFRKPKHVVADTELTIASIIAKYTHKTGARYSTKEMTAILSKAGLEPIKMLDNKDSRNTVCRVYNKEFVNAFFASELGRPVYCDPNFTVAQMPVVDIHQLNIPLAKSSREPVARVECVEPIQKVATEQPTIAGEEFISESAFQSMFVTKASAPYRLGGLQKITTEEFSIITTNGSERVFKKSDVIKFLDVCRRDTINRDSKIYKEHFSRCLSALGQMSPAEQAEYESITSRLQKLHDKFGTDLVIDTKNRLITNH